MEVPVSKVVVHVFQDGGMTLRTIGFQFPEQKVFLVQMEESFLVVPDRHCRVVVTMPPETWSGEKLARAMQYITAAKVFSNHGTVLEVSRSPLGDREVEEAVEGPSGLFPRREEEVPSPFWRNTQLDHSLRQGLEDRDM